MAWVGEELACERRLHGVVEDTGRRTEQEVLVATMKQTDLGGHVRQSGTFAAPAVRVTRTDGIGGKSYARSCKKLT